VLYENPSLIQPRAAASEPIVNKTKTPKKPYLPTQEYVEELIVAKMAAEGFSLKLPNAKFVKVVRKTDSDLTLIKPQARKPRKKFKKVLVVKPVVKHWGPESRTPVNMETGRWIRGEDHPQVIHRENSTKFIHE
jgi:hypothetical protein